MLAPRILHFAHNQIFWDCGALSACEALPSGLPLPLDDSASTDRHWRGRLQESSSLAHAPLSGANDDSLEGFWSSSVLRYTKCNLTSQADKTVAIWSIAKLVRDALGDGYGAGMWSTALEEQLGWRTVDMKKSKRSVDLQWRQPSWSWTSIQGAVLAGERVVVERCYRVRGHDGKAISFESKGLKRPKAEREHSDSLKEDLEIGWGAWQKKSADSLSRVIKEKRAARGQSTPSRPMATKSTASSSNKHAGMAPKTDPRDIEPELATKSLAINAPIGSGYLYPNTETGTYTLKVKTITNDKTNASITPNDSTPPGSSPDIIFEAFPDESPSELDFAPNLTQFLILAATEHNSRVSPFGLGVDIGEYDSDNEPDIPTNTTYSGIGIMLIEPEEYLRRSSLHAQLKEAMEKMENYLSKKESTQKASGKKSIVQKSDDEMQCLIRLIAFTFSRKVSGEEWTVTEWKNELENLIRLIVQLEWHKRTAERHRHFRRTGFLRFRDLSKEMYAEVMQGQAVKFWLD